jgi:hypothetical protein
MADINAFKLDFDEAIDFFKQKLRLPTASWTDIWQQQHDAAFVVAGAMRDDMLADFQTAIMKALKGSTLETFRKDFDAIVAKYGWDYNGGRNWRTRVIYETNLDMAYAAGRYQQLQSIKRTNPYWRYKHSLRTENARPNHLSWSGLVLSADDPWWNTHYPPNGWGCKCRVYSMTQGSLERMGKTEPDQAPEIIMQEKLVGVRGATPRLVQTPEGIDPGFAYNPGKAYYQGHAIKPAATPNNKACNSIDDPCNPWKSYFIEKLNLIPRVPARDLPKQSYAPEKIMAQGLTDTAYLTAFMAEFNAQPNDVVYFQDAIGNLLPISKELFINRSNGELKIQKNGREQYLLLLADTIKNPQEIWIDVVDRGDKLLIKRRYINIYANDAGEVAGLAVFDLVGNEWRGTTLFNPAIQPDREIIDYEYIDQKVRQGLKVFEKK